MSSAYAYGYNAAGWITSATTLSGTDVITHDASGRLTDECGPQVVTPNHCNHWTYDANGNLLTAVGDAGATDVYTYSATQINAQVAGGSSTSPPTATIALAYDGHGDTTSISNPVSLTPSDPGYQKYALAESFAYDAQQRPITVTRLVADKVNGQTLVTPLTATMQYNADGLRSDYYLTPDPRTGKQPVDTRFAYRAGQLASATVTDSTGTLLYKNTFLYGPGGEPLELVRTNPNGTTSRYWYVLDGQNNVVALTDQTGKVVDRYAYDSWGEQTSNDAVDETVPQQLRYRGYYYDEKLTWYWVTTRYYDPEGMRWFQPDPSDLDGVHTYAYVGDDPVDSTDPSGLCLIELHTENAFLKTFGPFTAQGFHAYITTTENSYVAQQSSSLDYKGHVHTEVVRAMISRAKLFKNIMRTTTYLFQAFPDHTSVPNTLQVQQPQRLVTSKQFDNLRDRFNYRALEHVWEDTLPCSCYVQKFKEIGKAINDEGIIYDPFFGNSNAAAYTLLLRAGLPVPQTLPSGHFTPGWGNDLLFQTFYAAKHPIP